MINIPDFVYPKDSKGNALCPQCQKLVAECDCPSFEDSKPKLPTVKPVARVDKSGRRGKVVTVIGGLPPSEVFLKDLAKELKMKTGSGGTFYVTDEAGIVEIQGDHQELVNRFFKNQK